MGDHSYKYKMTKICYSYFHKVFETCSISIV